MVTHAQRIGITIGTTLLLIAMACLLLRPVRASSTILTGTIKDEQGNPLNGYAIFQLPVPAQDSTTNTAVAPIPVRFNIVNGGFVGGAPLYDVANLQPQNLYYQVSVYDTSGTFVMGGNYAVTGATFNLGAAIPTNITTSNISYASPALLGANNTFTGNNLFQGNVQLEGPINEVGPSGFTFDGNSSNPAGAFGDLNWRTDLLRFLFFDGSWHIIPGQDTNNSWSGVQTFTSSPPFVVNSSTLVPNLNVQVLNGVTVSGAPTAGQALVATSPTAAGWSSSLTPVQVFSNTSVSNVTVSAATNIAALVVTMPSAGCPCRAFFSYSLYLDYDSFTNSTSTDIWVNDGTTTMGGLQTGVSNANTGGKTSASYAGYSPGTYANNAAITFTLIGQTSSQSVNVVAAPNAGSGPNSNFQVAVVSSN